MSKFVIEITLDNGKKKQVKVYVDNRTGELLNQCDTRVTEYIQMLHKKIRILI